MHDWARQRLGFMDGWMDDGPKDGRWMQNDMGGMARLLANKYFRMWHFKRNFIHQLVICEGWMSKLIFLIAKMMSVALALKWRSMRFVGMVAGIVFS